jgi:hypothetical protein
VDPRFKNHAKFFDEASRIQNGYRLAMVAQKISVIDKKNFFDKKKFIDKKNFKTNLLPLPNYSRLPKKMTPDSRLPTIFTPGATLIEMRPECICRFLCLEFALVIAPLTRNNAISKIKIIGIFTFDHFYLNF